MGCQELILLTFVYRRKKKKGDGHPEESLYFPIGIQSRVWKEIPQFKWSCDLYPLWP